MSGLSIIPSLPDKPIDPVFLNLKVFGHTTTFHTQFCSLKLLLFWCPQLLQFLIHLQLTIHIDQINNYSSRHDLQSLCLSQEFQNELQGYKNNIFMLSSCMCSLCSELTKQFERTCYIILYLTVYSYILMHPCWHMPPFSHSRYFVLTMYMQNK